MYVVRRPKPKINLKVKSKVRHESFDARKKVVIEEFPDSPDEASRTTDLGVSHRSKM